MRPKTKLRRSFKLGKVVNGELIVEKLPKQRNVRSYPEEIKVLARVYWAQGMTMPQISEQLGVSEGSVCNWVNKIPTDEQELLRENDLSESIRKNFSNKLMGISSRLFSSVNDKKIDKSSLMQLVIAGKITAETGRLFSGQSTQNIHMISQSVSTRVTAIDTLDAERDSLERRLDGSKIIDVNNENDDSNNDE